MARLNQKDMISTDEARIMLLEQKNDVILQALSRIEARIDQSEAHIEARLDARFDAIDARFDAVDARFSAVDTRMDTIDTRLNQLDTRIESNFKWLLRFTISGFVSILALIAHGFHWLQ